MQLLDSEGAAALAACAPTSSEFTFIDKSPMPSYRGQAEPGRK